MQTPSHTSEGSASMDITLLLYSRFSLNKLETPAGYLPPGLLSEPEREVRSGFTIKKRDTQPVMLQ